MPNLDEIKEQIESVKGNSKLSKMSEVKELPKILFSQERIVEIAKGRYNKTPGIIVVTDSRVILLTKVLFGGSKTEEFTFDKITSIENEKVPPLLLGKIKILAMGNEAFIDNMDYEESRLITALIRESISRPKEVGNHTPKNTSNEADAFTKLEKLNELYEKKIITEAEYQAKKSELLSSI